jgi:cytochrome c553
MTASSENRVRFSFARRAAGVCVALAMVVAVVATTGAHQTPQPPATRPADAPQEATPPFTPIAYFETNCSRCHGPFGANYTPAHLAALDDKELRRNIKEMAEGPGNAPLDAASMSVLFDYHRAIAEGQAFAFVTERADRRIAGEIVPEAGVELVDGPGVTAGKNNGDGTFVIELKSPPSAEAKLRTTLKGKARETPLPAK